MDDLNPVAVRIGQIDAKTAAGCGTGQDRGIAMACERVQVLEPRRLERKTDAARLASFGDVHEWIRAAAAHVEFMLGACDTGEAEVGQKRLHQSQVRGAVADGGDVGDADDGGWCAHAVLVGFAPAI
jgi:hypothetical protein